MSQVQVVVWIGETVELTVKPMDIRRNWPSKQESDKIRDSCEE